jgi:hypothetical protein
MPSELDKKLKTGLDENRLLILGAQVLLGFQFESFFQDGFPELAALSKHLCLAALACVTVAVVLLVVPSMQHRMIEEGHASGRLLGATSFYAGLALAPLALSLTLSAYVVLERHFGALTGIIGGLGFGGLAAAAWFGFEYLIGLAPEKRSMHTTQTPLGTRIEQVLTEARLIIPGGQALFGFQFVAMLTTGFDRLPQASKIVHAVALGLIALNIVLVMMPAAVHRLSYGGEDSKEFLRIASALVIAAPLFLAAGIATETYVVLQKVLENPVWGVAGACGTFFVFMLCWYVLPLVLKHKARAGKIPTRALSR